MKDVTVLMDVVKSGCVCPWCHKSYLTIKAVPAGLNVVGCEVCEENWSTFRDLFIAIAQDCRWGPDAWDIWVKAHPAYELPPVEEPEKI